MIAAKPQEEFVTWSVPGRFRRITYAAPLMRALAREAVEGYELSPNGGIEVGGILFGTIAPDEIRIVASRPVPCLHEYGPQFRLSPTDERNLRDRLSASLEDPGLAGLIPVGWYHSHTRQPIELTEDDRRLWDAHFSQPWQIALVLRPENGEPTRAGFFFRPEGGGAVQVERSHKVFEADPSHATSYETMHRLAALVDSAREPEPPALPPGPLPEELFWQPDQPGFFHRFRWVIAVLVVALASGFAWTRLRPAPAAKAMPHLGLRVLSEDGQLKAVWNRHVKVIESARGGAIEILRGDEKTVLPLSPALLKSGALPIPMALNEIKVRLELDVADIETDGPVFEVAHYIGSPLARYAPPSAETSRLREEVVQSEGKLLELSSANNRLAAEIEDIREAAAKQAELARQETRRRDEEARRELQRTEAAAEARKQEQSRLGEEARRNEQARRDEELRLARERQQKLAPAAPEPSPSISSPPPPPAQPAAVPAAAVPASPASAPPAVAAYTGPRSGKVIWTGFLGAGASLTVDGRRASVGSVNGSLPGVPVRVSVYPAEFAGGGLTVYSGAARHQGGAEEARSAQNGWLNTKYKYDPDRARGVSLTAAPSAQTGHRQLAIRAGDRPLSAIVIEWELVR